jgi:hypothetical protein
VVNYYFYNGRCGLLCTSSARLLRILDVCQVLTGMGAVRTRGALSLPRPREPASQGNLERWQLRG